MNTRFYSILFLLVLGINVVIDTNAQNIQNPVLLNVADAGVLKYNGKYYIGGVFTDGDFYISKDLVNWEGPVHVFSMDNDWTRDTGAGDNQIHANDIHYLNGEFHMYWSVNHWGKDRHAVHIAHAVADDVLGPYVEPVKDTWMDNRIDPMVFRDDDGKLYMYMVRFTDGNTIWVRPMKDWATFDGHPVYQFASLPNTWETMDNRVAEGPWVIKYRERYYMIYNANHTGTAWGNYQFGVAEADSPTSFNHGNKYAYPVLGSNQTQLEENYVDLLLFGKSYSPEFIYTEEKPGENWHTSSFNASSWNRGRGGFAAREIEGSTVRKQGTVWTTPELYVRKPFEVSASQTGNLALRVTHNGDTRIYLNGKLIYDKKGREYCIVNLTKEQRAALMDGENLLAVETKGGVNNYFNVSLFDMKADVADEILYSPGQPNILRGPNGFEWWLIYMADNSKDRRSQYINRVHFFDKTMYVDGVTAGNTKGYFPEPTKPTYGDAFDSEVNWKSNWTASGDWLVKDGELVVSGSGMAQAIANNQYKSTASYLEVGVNTSSQAGVIPFWKDENNWVRVGLNSADRSWFLEKCVAGKVSVSSFELPTNFRFGVYYTIIVERNQSSLTIRIDDIPAPGQSFFPDVVSGEAVPGLFATNGKTSFDGLVYTIGWDESGEKIEGWQEEGSSVLSIDGLKVASTTYQALKGDYLSQYEFALQIGNDKQEGEAGVYPIYVDSKNYVKASVNYLSRQLEVMVVKKGKETLRKSYPLAKLQTHYADMKYTDTIEKAFYFRYPIQTDEIRVNRIASHDDEVFIDNMFTKVDTEYLLDGKWYPLNTANAGVSSHPSWNSVTFDSQKMEAIRFINNDPEDLNSYIYKIRVNELMKDSYNLRTVKLKDSLILIVDGEEVARIKIDFPEATVGLYAKDAYPLYNGILRYHVPE